MPFPEPDRYPPPFTSKKDIEDTTSSGNIGNSNSRITDNISVTGINLCYFGNDRMYGLKQIWLQQSQFLNKVTH